jgi:hypothetical protein
MNSLIQYLGIPSACSHILGAGDAVVNNVDKTFCPAGVFVLVRKPWAGLTYPSGRQNAVLRVHDSFRSLPNCLNFNFF